MLLCILLPFDICRHKITPTFWSREKIYAQMSAYYGALHKNTPFEGYAILDLYGNFKMQIEANLN